MQIFSFRFLIFSLLVLIIAFLVLIKAFRILSVQSTLRIIMLAILFSLVVICLFSEPLHAESFTSEMDRGAIARTPLLQPGQTLTTLPPGLYRVTGGYVNVGFLPKGNVIKITGIMVDQYPTTLAG